MAFEWAVRVNEFRTRNVDLVRVAFLSQRNGLRHLAFGRALQEYHPPLLVLEAALRSILELDPEHPQARHNLRVLMRNTGRWVEGVIDPPPA